MSNLSHDEINAAFNRTSQHDPANLNAVANAVLDVLGFTDLTRRYAIAVLALEEMRPCVTAEDAR